MPPLPYVSALATAPSVPFENSIYRVIDGELVAYEAGFEYLYTSGIENRYNPSGIQALYASTTDETAKEEFEKSLRGAGLDPSLVDQFQFVIQVRLVRVLDLTDESVRNHLGVTLPQLLATWEDKDGKALTQVLGAAIDEGIGDFSAIKYPSAANPGGVNLVMFHGRMKKPDLIRPLSRKARKQWP